MERHKKAMGAAKKTGKTIAKAAAVTHEAGRRAGQSKVGQAVKKSGTAVFKAGAEKAKKDIESLKAKNRVKKEEFDVFDTILEFLIDEQIAQDIQEANWIMANAISEEQIDEILGMFKKKKEKPPVEYAGRSMKKPDDLPYSVDRRRTKMTVTEFGKGGKTSTYKTYGKN